MVLAVVLLVVVVQAVVVLALSLVAVPVVWWYRWLRWCSREREHKHEQRRRHA